MANYKVSTSPCGCKSIVKEEVKQITTCDCCTIGANSNYTQYLGQAVCVRGISGSIYEFDNDWTISNFVLQGTETTVNAPLSITLCNIEAITTGALK
ncbi:hypothetical protein [Cytobacillus sp. IB215665]|uniref:hypothetical protein n=1 Tax=Cytobacillus sp. IB215665 TaxID=3097357 RepID=UPI002A10B4F1|nr:hypothetical protein [Cytobacillus sp. IB215665]MDX8365528.1 hypothetical protein [Cytobacillus sp. IB215665]